MRIPALLPTVFIASAAASALAAQESRITRVGPGTVLAPRGFAFFSNEPRAIIGVSTTNAATSRDTLGVLVSTVRAGSPADKAGIEEGNRIASINGVSLRLSAADVGDDAMAGVLSRRLQRELDKLNPGDDVDLQVVANGQTKTMKIKTVAPPDIHETLRRPDDRATLGLNLAVTGSSRDSIGVFVLSVQVREVAIRAEARVVHKHVNPGRRGERRDTAYFTGDTEIGGQRCDRDPVFGLNLIRQRRQAICRSGDEHQIAAAPRQLPGELQAEPGGCSGD